MVNILKPKVNASGFVDLIAIGAAKQLEERFTSGIIGNGTLTSGIIKGIACAMIDGKGGRIGHIVSGAFGVDAGEDIAIALMGMVGAGGAASGTSAAAW
jgi:glycine cleavage system aminomethyltransferase T